ncbi:hypothetical protein AMS68_004715 [Peltaster fructicola]|uniref:F-box domain-containing protein n=1 Tax=Peltaster fructicola TaxID=286661 RepID=A0A6H0XX79_9PEZI|nr:hypothetical protein AMS68_004715 [Peltaster fructicola]
MFSKLRIGSKKRVDSSSHPNGANFLSLPAELRNNIYECVLEDTATLTMVPRKAFIKPKPPAMLLVSRQVRAEYQPILLTRARIVANVYNYDFRDISSVVSSLYPTQLKLLRLNNTLVIKLHCLRCRPQDLDLLRRWLVKRADPLDRLSWSYEVGWSRITVALSAKPDMLVGHLEMLNDMKTRSRLDERVAWEMLPIQDCIRQELETVQQELANSALQT